MKPNYLTTPLAESVNRCSERPVYIVKSRALVRKRSNVYENIPNYLLMSVHAFYTFLNIKTKTATVAPMAMSAVPIALMTLKTPPMAFCKA
jgi:hypothetical protein